MNYAGVLAGGKGTRMGTTEQPKQYLRMGSGGKPILIHTLKVFLDCKTINAIVVACPQSWLDYTKELIAEYYEDEEQNRIYVIAGGEERFDSLANICNFLEVTFNLSDDDILVSHDAVRPFLTQRILEENIKYATEYGCVDTVVPATDTLVRSDEGITITDIPPRSQFYQGQTPQSFRIREYCEAFNALTYEQKMMLTDACKVYLFHNKPVYLVMGEYYNIKITTPYDLSVGESILLSYEE